MSKRNPMPVAHVVLVCEDCGQEITEVPLNTDRLAAALFRLRKEHAKQVHGWQESMSE